jgi:hypothetical protein
LYQSEKRASFAQDFLFAINIFWDGTCIPVVGTIPNWHFSFYSRSSERAWNERFPNRLGIISSKFYQRDTSASMLDALRFFS